MYFTVIVALLQEPISQRGKVNSASLSWEIISSEREMPFAMVGRLAGHTWFVRVSEKDLELSVQMIVFAIT